MVAKNIFLQIYFKMIILKNFTKLIGKYLCQSLFLDKVVDLGLQ